MHFELFLLRVENRQLRRQLQAALNDTLQLRLVMMEQTAALHRARRPLERAVAHSHLSESQS